MLTPTGRHSAFTEAGDSLIWELMRTHGTVPTASGHVPYGHLCWAYTGRSEFRTRAVEYLSDGAAVGQWLEYVGTGSREALQAELAETDRLARLLDDGALVVTPVDEFYALQPGSTTVDPHAAVTARVGATKQALADGYTGFRAVVDATAMAATPHQRAAFVQFEHLIDQIMASLPVTALCGYNRTELGHAAVAELACLHPLSNTDGSFRLYAQPDGSLALAGDIDHRCAELFIHALGAAADLAPDQNVILDLQALTTIAPDQLLELDRLAREHERVIELRAIPPATTRLIHELRLTHLSTTSETS